MWRKLASWKKYPVENNPTRSHPQVPFIFTQAHGTDPYSKFFLPLGIALSGAWPNCACCLKQIKVLRGLRAWWQSIGQRLGLRRWPCLRASYFTSVSFFPLCALKVSTHSRQPLDEDLPLDHLCPIFMGIEESVHLSPLCSHLPSILLIPKHCEKKMMLCCGPASQIPVPVWVCLAFQKFFKKSHQNLYSYKSLW